MGRTVRVRSVGVELEGAWLRSRGITPYGDGTVETMGNLGLSRYEYIQGEICIPAPGLPPERALRWMSENYPDEGDSSCGLHVHMGLAHKLYYARLMDREYCEFLYTELDALGNALCIPRSHPFWYRLQGHNGMCHKPVPRMFMAQVRATRKGDHRYYGVNFAHGLHGTVEIRVLPFFEDVDYAVRMVRCVVTSTNQFLADRARLREPWLTASWEDDAAQLDLDIPRIEKWEHRI